MVTNSSPISGRANDTAGWGKPDGVAALLEVAEPRCRICRDPLVRRLVNDLLEERRQVNAMLNVSGGSASASGAPDKITYTSILAALEPLNEGLAERDQVTYDSLWVHARRHDSTEGRAAYWAARADKELRRALEELRAQQTA